MAPPPKFSGFSPAALTFLRGLARNNGKAWFEPRRETYEREVKAPLQQFVEEIDNRLGLIAPELIGHPKRSVFRIYRDVRFSEDKSPYKTAAACWFFHRDVGHGVGQRTQGGAGLYFQIAPKESFVAAGLWMPPGETLARIRDALVEDVSSFETILKHTTFRKTFGTLSDEAVLTRMPRGYDLDAEHPAARWIRYKSFTVSRDLTTAELHDARLADIVTRYYAAAVPLVRWLNGALGYRAATRR